MITIKNFEDLLKTLEFETDGNTYKKSIGKATLFGEATLKVDFENNKITYPDGLTVNRDDIRNLSQNENFVVFECVHRLLEKGYKPEHLELEPTWQVGRGASGGRADILVRDHENNPLLLIECKTAGEEFERAWRKTRQNGDQLFSYAQQIPQTQYLCLYTSDLVLNKNSSENEIRKDQRIIAHRDNEKILAQNDKLQPFEDATDVEDRYAIWCDTYEQEYTESGIFEPNIQPYQIGKNKYTLEDDTTEVDEADAKKEEGKYNQFVTILRQHTIARREQAFEVLVNLFLCKLVDEENNKTDLKFSWKGIAYDNYFDFVDRLQNLYRTGMNKYLGKEISYISNEEIDKAFWAVRNDRNATKKKIQEYFRKLKFFTNSAFSFLDTHNEELFKRNAKVLLEIVQMWQGVRLKTDVQNLFLGEMFELFLDSGIKQSEGQFFTPLPICKFIVGSLPLAQKIKENSEPLKVIDYACGSGHFLNEYAYQIKEIDEKDEIDREIDLNDYYSQILGIEKEDRLAKVAKVAAYMHGQDQIKILDADALAFLPDEVKPETFDVLVANPPYAVEGFLQTLNGEDKRQYQLIQTTGENSNTDTIECFFLERIHHLMAPGGIVGVIVRDSITYNTDAVYTGTREILLQYFDLVSIAKLESSTFWKTTTKTVVLFLRRKEPRPEVSEQYENRVTNFFEGDKESEIYQDDDLIKAYCNHIEIPYEEYIKLFNQTRLESLSELLEYDIFKDYEQAFNPDKEIEKIKKSKEFRGKTESEQLAELGKRLITYIHKIEKDKLYYFILAHKQENKVLVINAPSTNKEQQKFLGYKWSNARNNEGIKYNGGDTVNDIITPLFDPKDLDNDTKINTAIKRNFIGETTDPLPEHCHYANLTDMLNFSRPDFKKVINLNPKQNIDIETQWDLVKLGKVVNIIRGVTYNKNQEAITPTSRIILTADNITLDGTFALKKQIFLNESVDLDDKKRLMAGDIFICFSSGSKKHVGKTAYIKHNTEYYAGGFMGILRNKDTDSLNKYVFELLNLETYRNIVRNTGDGSNINNLSSALEEIKIPLPSLQIQQQIVDECEMIDRETEHVRQTITAAKQQIEEKVNHLWGESRKDKLDNLIWINTKTYNPTLKPDDEFIYIDIESVGKADGVIDCSQRLTGKNAPSRARRIAKNGNTIISTVRPNLKGFAFVDIDNIDDCVFSTGFAVFESKSMDILLDKVIYYFFMYMDELMQQMIDTMDKSSYPSINEDDIKYYQIPVPPIDIQQQLIAEVEPLEARITEAQAVIDNATERKNVILKKYL